MTIAIKHRWSGSALFVSETAPDLKGAVQEATMARANLTGANLTDADLTRANLTGANLTDADLARANLTRADLETIKADLLLVLGLAGRSEVETLLEKVRAGQIDGSAYEGVCACLVGTIANARHVAFTAIPGLVPDGSRPAERFFLAIKPGHTPESSQVSAVVAQWIEEWLANPEPETVQARRPR